MIRYAVGAAPWWVVASAAFLVVTLMELVRWHPGELWALEGTAVGVMAGVSALCFDERSAAVVDAAPRSLAWRTAARSAGPAVLVIVWTMVVLHDGDGALFGHRGQVMLQGWVAAVVGAALASWARSGGAATPGIGFLTAVVPLTTAWALVRPWQRALPLFPYADGRPPFGDWGTSQLLWSSLGVLALAVLAAALADARWLPARARSAGPHETAREKGQGPVHTSP